MGNKKYKFYFIGLAHLPCDPYYNSCGFTMKNYKFCKMMMDLGHEVIYFGAEGSTVPCSKFVMTHTLKDIRNDYGSGDNRFDIGYDFKKEAFRVDFGEEKKKLSTQKLYSKAIEVINIMKQPDDFLLLCMGWYQKPISDSVKLFLTCEHGVGYKGSYTGAVDYRWTDKNGNPTIYSGFRAFESHFLRSYMQGVESLNREVDGNSYDRVIPNFFEEEEFEFNDKKENYLLYLGRITKRKGIMTAYLAAQEAGMKLIIAGQGGGIKSDGTFYSRIEPQHLSIPKGNWEFAGYADIEKRKKLLKNTKALLVPSMYLEPFAGTHVEAMLSGTPVITSTNGVFGGDETFIHGVHGFKCNTMEDYVRSIKNIDKIDCYKVRKCGERYLTKNIKWEYQQWFDDLYNLYQCKHGSKKSWKEILKETGFEWQQKGVTILG